mmetsp:Transcript_1610/g.1993  ORF Transcript_1610/g.1993 Transcript_1610/m.1993 type:complete len:159 (-) Transcript_1610:106-582(-)
MATKKEVYERPGLSQDEIEELKEAFALFDHENKGSIDGKELKSAMESLGYKKKNKMVHQMIESIDKEKKEITFPAFLDMMTAKISDTDSRDDIMKVFQLFDEEDKGYITVDNLKNVTRELGENMTKDELAEMITRADTDDDGKVSFEDFYAIMTKKSY